MSYERSDVDPLGGAVSVRAVRCVCVCVRVALALFMAHRGCAARPGWPARSARAAARAAGSGRGAVRSCAFSRDAGAAVAVADASGIASSNRNRVRRRPGPTPRRPGDRIAPHAAARARVRYTGSAPLEDAAEPGTVFTDENAEHPTRNGHASRAAPSRRPRLVAGRTPERTRSLD